VTAEVDWGEATVRLAGVVSVVGLFLMRSCFSGACFVMAFETQRQRVARPRRIRTSKVVKY